MRLIDKLSESLVDKIIFQQERIGLNGKPFTIYKIRTMYYGAEKDYEELMKKKGPSPHDYDKILNDPRLILGGKFLRNFRIDELPQLYNIYKGEMQLIGLRPLMRRSLDNLDEEHVKRREKYKPGLISPFIGTSLKSKLCRQKIEAAYLDALEAEPTKTKIKCLLNYGKKLGKQILFGTQKP